MASFYGRDEEMVRRLEGGSGAFPQQEQFQLYSFDEGSPNMDESLSSIAGGGVDINATTDNNNERIIATAAAVANANTQFLAHTPTPPLPQQLPQQLPQLQGQGQGRASSLNVPLASAAAGTATNPLNFTNAPSRTVYLGNIPPDVTLERLLDHVQSGVVEDCKVLRDKSCAFITFLDENSALLFHSESILKRLNIDGRDVKIGWGKRSLMDPLVATRVKYDGATRNVFVGNLENTNITLDDLKKDLGQFGEIDCIKFIADKGIAFVHFASIIMAITAVTNLANVNAFYRGKKVFYGKDRCAFITRMQQYNAAQFLGLQSEDGIESIPQLNDRDFISNTLLQQSAAAAAIATSAGGPNNLGNRTIYLGNLPRDIKIEDICNVVRGGLLQRIKLLPDRFVCFITFIDPTAAAQFYAMSSLHGLAIQKKRCKIGWGKHSGPLPNDIAAAVGRGFSRNIYVGNIDWTSEDVSQLFSEQRLRQLFEQYGEVEQINFLPEKNCCFINFTDIGNALVAMDAIRAMPQFQQLKVNFGKDRCGNIPQQTR